MKQNCKAMLLCLCLTALILSLSACGAGRTGAATAPAAAPSPSTAATNESMDMAGSWANAEMAQSAGAPPMAPEGDKGGGSAVYRDENAKLIRRAVLRLQTTEFNEAVQFLDQLVRQCGGYYENANVYSGSYRDLNAARLGDYVIRIPAQQYDTFLAQSGSLGHILEKNESSQDIGDQYYDTEARLKTQQAKHERLLNLLEQSATMEDIIQLENALSQTEYEIEILSSTLSRYDSLVGFATIDLVLEEVLAIKDDPGQTASLGEQMAAGLKASWHGLGNGIQSILIFVSYNVVGLAWFAAFAGVGVFVGRRMLKAKKQDTNGQEK